MSLLTFERLRDAVAGDAVAFRSRITLQPAGGEGDKIFPPSYSVDSRAEQVSRSPKSPEEIADFFEERYGHDRAKVLFHAQLLSEAGFLGSPHHDATALTWAGYELLDQLTEGAIARDESNKELLTKLERIAERMSP